MIPRSPEPTIAMGTTKTDRRTFLAGAASTVAAAAMPNGALGNERMSTIGPTETPVLEIHAGRPDDDGRRIVVPVRRTNPTAISCTAEVSIEFGLLRRTRLSTHVLIPWNVDEVLVPFEMPRGWNRARFVATLKSEMTYGENRTILKRRRAGLASGPSSTPDGMRSIVHGAYPRIERPVDYVEAFRSDLVDGFVATDSGYEPDGTPCWKTQLGHGRIQWNGEIGIATDPALHADHGADPFRIEDGRRVLVAQKLTKPIRYLDKVWHYSGPMLTTETMFVSGYGWIEARVAFDEARGIWPAFWMKCRGLWPPEEDILEWAQPNDDPAENMPFFTQWWLGPGKRMAGAQVRIRDLIPGFDPREMHTYALHWTEEMQVWTIDGVPVHSQPNRNVLGAIPGARDEGRMYLKLNVAVGGLGGEPDDAKLPARMRVGHVAAWSAP